MPGSNEQRIVYRAVSVLALVLIYWGRAGAEHLPIKTYTTADGLAHNVVNRVVRDSRGFLWFCTSEGLSRFDGYSFTNYGIEQGLPSALVNDLLETRDGRYWVATSGGLCRFNPLGKPQAAITLTSRKQTSEAMFTVYFPAEDARSKHILSLLQDDAGTIWCGTQNGLYRLDVGGADTTCTFMDLGIPNQFESRFVECLLEDRRGALWVGSRNGLYRRWPDGRVEAYSTRDGLTHQIIFSLLEDRKGRIWVGTASGWLCRLVPDPAPGRQVVAHVYTDKDGLPTRWINQLFEAKDGSLWAASIEGLIQFVPTADGRDLRFRVYAEPHGFSYHEVASLAEDGNGNLWLALLHGGRCQDRSQRFHNLWQGRWYLVDQFHI